MAKKKVKSSARQASKLKILVANGVNLDLLGKREKAVYGSFDLSQLETFIKEEGSALSAKLGLGDLSFEFYQTNNETELLEKLSSAKFDGLLLNPAAWTHTSVALRDRLAALSLTFVEVHISNLAAREEFRKVSYSAAHASGVVYGFGMESYLVGLFGLLRALSPKKTK